MKKLLAGMMVILFAGCSPTRDRLVTPATEAIQKTVMVYVPLEVTVLGKKQPEAMALGSGVFISPNGHILTCDHVVADEEIEMFGAVIGTAKRKEYVIIIQYDGTTQAAEVLFRDPSRDLALLKINAENTPYARIADPRTLAVGQEVFAVGNPHGLDFSVSHGIISALTRDLDTGYNLIQTDAPINPGNSGGPLFNVDVELVGLVNSGADGDGLGFAVNAGQVIEFLTKFRGADKALPKFDLSYWGK